MQISGTSQVIKTDKKRKKRKIQRDGQREKYKDGLQCNTITINKKETRRHTNKMGQKVTHFSFLSKAVLMRFNSKKKKQNPK